MFRFQNTICGLNLRLNREKDEKERMLVKFRQELAFKQQEIDSLKRLSQDITAISTAQEMSLSQNEKLKSVPLLGDRYSNMLPRIISTTEQNDVSINTNKVRLSVGCREIMIAIAISTPLIFLL